MHNNEDKDKTILLSSKPVEISEYKDYKLATFLISVLDEYDLNGRMIPRSVAEKCGETIIGAPILAKLIYDPFTGKPCDFGGHETYWTVDDDGRDEMCIRDRLRSRFRSGYSRGPGPQSKHSKQGRSIPVPPPTTKSPQVGFPATLSGIHHHLPTAPVSLLPCFVCLL